MHVALHGTGSFIHSHRSQEHKAEGIMKTVLASLQEKCGENSVQVARALQGLGLAYDKLKLYDKSLWVLIFIILWCVHWHLVLYLPSRHCYERAITIISNPAAPDAAGLKTDIGCLFMHKGDYRQSIAYFEESIAEYMQNMPPGYANSAVICRVLCLHWLSFMKEHPWLVAP